MRNIVYLFILLLLSCDNPLEKTTCPPEPRTVLALTVDYTTNKFLDGYSITLPSPNRVLDMQCDYKEPGDFGSIVWYDKITETKLFAGTIVWMGKGAQTFPEEKLSSKAVEKGNNTREMPEIVYLSHSKYDIIDENIDYEPIWQSIANLNLVNCSPNSGPVYIYLYRPSVGVGNPKDWYWVIFLEY